MTDMGGNTESAGLSTKRLLTVLRRRSVLSLSFVFFVAVVTYSRTIQYWFATADSLALIETSRIRNPTDLVDLLTQPLMHGSSFTEVALFYRPLSSLSYAVDYALWGLSPAGYHLTNVVLHAIAAVLVTFVVAEMTSRLLVGGLSGVLFAVHPLTIGVVPGIARRQDVLLAIFVLVALGLVVRHQRENRPRLLGGALVAYALALGAKETALVVPGLVFAWVALDRDGRWRTGIRRAISAAAPFVAVTVGYLIVRIAVLGGLGGYRSGVGTEPNGSAVFLPLKYLLWLGQPASLVETVPVALRGPALLVVACGVLGGAVLVRRVWTDRRLEPPALLVWSVCLAAFAGFVCLLVVIGRTGSSSIPVVGASSTVVQYLVDSLFVGGCLSGLLAAGLTADPPFDSPTRRLVWFFAGWVVAIPGLLVVTGAGFGAPLDIGDQVQTGYLCLIPAMAGLSVVLVTAGERLLAAARSEGIRPDANAAVVVFTTVLLASLLLTSPLVHPSTEWQREGELNQRTLIGLDDSPPGANSSAPVSVREPPVSGDDHSPLVASADRLNGYTIDAWLRLRADHPNNDTSDERRRIVRLSGVATALSVVHPEHRRGDWSRSGSGTTDRARASTRRDL